MAVSVSFEWSNSTLSTFTLRVTYISLLVFCGPTGQRPYIVPPHKSGFIFGEALIGTQRNRRNPPKTYMWSSIRVIVCVSSRIFLMRISLSHYNLLCLCTYPAGVCVLGCDLGLRQAAWLPLVHESHVHLYRGAYGKYAWAPSTWVAGVRI